MQFSTYLKKEKIRELMKISSKIFIIGKYRFSLVSLLLISISIIRIDSAIWANDCYLLRYILGRCTEVRFPFCQCYTIRVPRKRVLGCKYSSEKNFEIFYTNAKDVPAYKTRKHAFNEISLAYRWKRNHNVYKRVISSLFTLVIMIN